MKQDGNSTKSKMQSLKQELLPNMSIQRTHLLFIKKRSGCAFCFAHGKEQHYDRLYCFRRFYCFVDIRHCADSEAEEGQKIKIKI